ncbi:hypothetical protein L596_029264 [Steinernema carpocapsae]|uniref:Uncharacterized protein n=1 Tax=Steinernema carpocapsae TaxID=34508 RepID=A0A4U5LU50_STECR|nr:hypothetical protein L596_029264 [Steinernema carpocapsae]
MTRFAVHPDVALVWNTASAFICVWATSVLLIRALSYHAPRHRRLLLQRNRAIHCQLQRRSIAQRFERKHSSVHASNRVSVHLFPDRSSNSSGRSLQRRPNRRNYLRRIGFDVGHLGASRRSTESPVLSRNRAPRRIHARMDASAGDEGAKAGVPRQQRRPTSSTP